MHYQLRHTTRYDYSAEVALSHNEARLLPRELSWQRVEQTDTVIHPTPVRLRERRDFFGNRVGYFSIQELHDSLEVTTTSRITTSPRPLPDNDYFITWEQAIECLRQGTECLDARLFMLDSDFVSADPALADYARASFTPGRSLVDAIYALNLQIFNEFTYDPEHTTIATPILDVLASRRGVCQDFAHLAIGCLRSLGLAARYVSGYMETLPPPGQPRLQGADATHAWLAVFIPGWGWLEIDPTNGCLPDERYIILGWGRDFSDVTPLKGVMTGGGNDRLTVAVDVIPLADEAPV
ncbi:transglutaminase [Zobellella endophytica]|uniref:Transglutaminase n=1 Tax=Zobellella endophytica TaxID=2116700 RepID=A0A2P7RB99_9GAMM|nr:transglutaminase family protein [Zobellella endophytica]PSJ47514.1 transglutaminase [Zobellella endophytica]